MYYLPNELWDIVKTYQLNWKPTHKKKFCRVTNDLKYIFDYLCCSRGCECHTVHNITGYFHKCYFTHIRIKDNVSLSHSSPHLCVTDRLVNSGS